MKNKCKLREKLTFSVEGKLKFIIDGNLRKKENKIEQLYS
jgi:hypothetical protein